MLPNTKLTPNAKLVNKSDVPVMKHSPPLGILYYLDYKYETLLETRSKKIIKITNRIDETA